MENMQNLDSILEEVGGFVEIPVNPKARPMTAEEIAAAASARKERADRKFAEPEEFESKETGFVPPSEPLLKLAGRVVSGLAVAAGSAVAEAAGLMDVRLALPLGVAALCFVAFWAGAGVQWKFGGLLDE